MIDHVETLADALRVINGIVATRKRVASTGGTARAKRLTKKQRQQIARKAGIASGASRARKAKAKVTEICMDCDGCGWYEGGRTIKTTCATCGGTGAVRR